MSQELIYLTLIFGLLVVPRALQRLKIPAPITCLLLGVGAMLLWGDDTHDPVVTLLSALGISSLFLFAGLEVDFDTLRTVDLGGYRLEVEAEVLWGTIRRALTDAPVEGDPA